MADDEKNPDKTQPANRPPDQPYVKSTSEDVARDLIRTQSFGAADQALARTIEWIAGLGPWARDRVLAFVARFQKKLDAQGVEPQAIPERVGVPVLQAVALEEREEIRELWANLLVSAATGYDVDGFAINIVKQLSPDAAWLLLRLARQPPFRAINIGARFDQTVDWSLVLDERSDDLAAPVGLILALSRLEALGLATLTPDWKRLPTHRLFRIVKLTPIGLQLVGFVQPDALSDDTEVPDDSEVQDDNEVPEPEGPEPEGPA